VTVDVIVNIIVKEEVMTMKLHNVHDMRFQLYGQILKGYDFTELIRTLLDKTPLPEDGFVYRGSDPFLEVLPIFTELRDRAFGGMPIQLGYCNGYNTRLNCLEYHRDSEICVMALDTILLLGQRSDIDVTVFTYDTSRAEAFLVPAGTGIELYATTLHYAPCCAKPGQGYQVANCLPKGTNGNRPPVGKSGEDKLLLGSNKWLLAHKESGEAAQGAHIGLAGENIDINSWIR
jgi:hypothetical protein